ncbi:hypothetical protein [Elstera litoralis]|nr:hypothetical protein [Elstera litoralis]
MVEDLLATSRSQFEADLLGYNPAALPVEAGKTQPDVLDQLRQLA